MPRSPPITARTTARPGTQPYSHRRISIHRWSYDSNGNVTSKTRESINEAPYELSPEDPEDPEEPEGITAGPSGSLPVHPEPQRDHVTSERARSPTPLVTDVPLAMVHDVILALLRNKATIEPTIESICVAHELNPLITESVMQVVRENLYLVDEQQSDTNANEPSSSAALPNAASTSTAPFFSFTPIKQSRPFQDGSTTWYSTRSMKDIEAPPTVHEPTVGDLYVHTNIDTETRQVWLYKHGAWERIDVRGKVYHPNVHGRVLNMRKDGRPNWVTGASFATMKRRKEKAAENTD